MIPVKPRVGDVVMILLDPHETGVVVETGAKVTVQVTAGHPVTVRVNEVRVLERAARLPDPACPSWCDRSHGGFDTESWIGSIAVEHCVTRGEVTFSTIEFLEPDGTREMTTIALDVLDSGGAYTAATTAELARDVRGLIADLTGVLAVLDEANTSEER